MMSVGGEEEYINDEDTAPRHNGWSVSLTSTTWHTSPISNDMAQYTQTCWTLKTRENAKSGRKEMATSTNKGGVENVFVDICIYPPLTQRQYTALWLTHRLWRLWNVRVSSLSKNPIRIIPRHFLGIFFKQKKRTGASLMCSGCEKQDESNILLLQIQHIHQTTHTARWQQLWLVLAVAWLKAQIGLQCVRQRKVFNVLAVEVLPDHKPTQTLEVQRHRNFIQTDSSDLTTKAINYHWNLAHNGRPHTVYCGDISSGQLLRL